jgi:hypothetical protein
MFAALLCLPVLLMLTSVCLARPLRYPVASQSCRLGQQPMPDLNAFLLHSNPRVFATGRLIKGLYYSEVPQGLNAIAAFYMACDHLLEQKPFLIWTFAPASSSLTATGMVAPMRPGHCPCRRLIQRISSPPLMERRNFVTRTSSASARSTSWLPFRKGPYAKSDQKPERSESGTCLKYA